MLSCIFRYDHWTLPVSYTHLIGKEIELEQKVETVGELVQYIEKKCQEDE